VGVRGDVRYPIHTTSASEVWKWHFSVAFLEIVDIIANKGIMSAPGARN